MSAQAQRKGPTGQLRAEQSLKATTVLQPLEPLPIERLNLSTEGLNPADWLEFLPTANLNIQARLEPQAEMASAVGTLHI
ncbi:MAG: hypothetical protein HC848_07710, partial [Limnobacter sp.]|nr:hypothetical protein [Limnobacter sp.]